MNLIPGYFYSTFTSLLWVLSCLGIGSFFTRKIENLTNLESKILSFLMGCVSWIILDFILFIFKAFKPPVITFLVYLLGILSLIFWLKHWIKEIKKPLVFDWQIIVLGIILFAQLLFCFIPITAFDALYYHLPLAKRMIETGTISWTPWIINAGLPQNYEMMQSMGLALGGDAGANLMSWWFGLASILTLIAIGTRLSSPKIGLWSAIALSITPIWFWLCGTSYIESFLTFGFCFMALCLVVKFPAWAIGASIGWLSGTKYWGLEVALIGFIIWVCQYRPYAKHIITAVVIACCVSLFWYIRNIYLFADPFFPLYSEWFSFLGKPRIEDAVQTAFDDPRIHHSPSTLRDWVILPFKLLANPSPEYCDDATLSWKHVGWFSIFWLFMFLLPKKSFKSILPVYVFALITTISWIFLHWITYLRYLTVILPLMYLFSFMLLHYWFSKLKLKPGLSRLITNIVLIIALVHLVGPTTNRSLIQIPFSESEKSAFLEDNIDGWSIIQELNTIKPPPNVYFLYGEGTRYYCEFNLFAGWHDPYDFYKFHDNSTSSKDLATWLDSIGIDILMINERRVRQLLNESERNHLNEILSDRTFTQTYNPYLIKHKPSPHSLSEISVYLKSKAKINK